MERAISLLKESIGCNDVDCISKYMEALSRETIGNDGDEIAGFSIDEIIKELLRRYPQIEIIEKIGGLSMLIRDPRNFQDELVAIMNNKSLNLPVLMLMQQHSQEFGCEYEHFYAKLVETITKENLQSEGYLVFMLQCLNTRGLEFSIVEQILKRLSQLSVVLFSGHCAKTVYCILLIMRLHPAAFKIARELKELSLLLHSFKSIREIVSRIYLEADDASVRPSVVFLQNLAFPKICDENINK